MNVENGNPYGDDSFVATPAAARQTISHISSCRALVVVRTVGVAEKITCILNGSKSLRRERAAQLDTCPADTNRSCMYEFPLSNSGESNAMLENSTFTPPKPHFRSVYCHSKASFRTRTIHPALVSITSRSITCRRNRNRMSTMLSRRLCISAASEVRVRISFSATYPTLKISTLRASENSNSVLKSLHAAA